MDMCTEEEEMGGKARGLSEAQISIIPILVLSVLHRVWYGVTTFTALCTAAVSPDEELSEPRPPLGNELSPFFRMRTGHNQES